MKPLLYFYGIPNSDEFARFIEVAVLGITQELYAVRITIKYLRDNFD